ncbi:Transcription initiation factor TFIID subunit 2 [Forsythia ovata]|uniref:Transcription initiation factor TFIID subunit 2 n=1 Tax=Forsythia ovata TaxID=205694 RepID=A0ABD1X808_9LAMI
MAVSSLSLGASLSIFSSQMLFDERLIDQTIETRIRLAYALARQWFGVYITPEASNDDWLLDGLAGFLTNTFIRMYLGNNEAHYRRYKYNDNNGNPYSDVFWLAALVQSVGELEFGQQLILWCLLTLWQSIAYLSPLLKRLDRLLQFDRYH